MAFTKTTKLDAVNTLLRAIGQSPVNSLAETTVDVSGAIQALDKASREIQSEGWAFNTEDEYTFVPDNDENIVIAANVLSIDLDTLRYPKSEYDVVMRGTRLYNRVGGTFNFSETLTATVILGFEWDDLPEHARAYITAKAKLSFVASSEGVDEASRLHAKEEQETYQRMRKLEGEQDDWNYLDSFMRVYGSKGF